MDLPERIKSFLLLFSLILSFPNFLILFADERLGAMEERSEETVNEDRHLLVALLEEEEASDFFIVWDFFFG